MADGSIGDTSSKFSKESSSSSSLSLSSSSSNDLSSDDESNQDEKSDNNNSAEDHETQNLFSFEVNLERRHEPDIDNLPLDKNAAQIVQQGHPLAKILPL
jgi:hypothetical protein